MSAPTTKLTVTQRYALKDLAWEKSQAVTPGRVMLCKGRKVVGYMLIRFRHTNAEGY